MNTRLWLIVILMPLWIAAFAKPKDSAVIKKVEAIERKRFTAQVNKDFTFLEKVFSPDLIYIHSGGSVSTKEDYIQSLKEGKTIYEAIDVESLQLRAYNHGKTVVINGKITMVLPAADGKTKPAHLRYAVVYIKEKGSWQLVMWQSLKLT